MAIATCAQQVLLGRMEADGCGTIVQLSAVQLFALQSEGSLAAKLLAKSLRVSARPKAWDACLTIMYSINHTVLCVRHLLGVRSFPLPGMQQ